MEYSELQALVMVQTNNDLDDVSEYETQLPAYLNEGYNLLYKRWMRKYPDTPLSEDTDVPDLPEYMHRAITDWATWLMYRNGNPSKQQRGLYFRQSFEKFLATIPDGGGLDEETRTAGMRFINLYDS